MQAGTSQPLRVKVARKDTLARDIALFDLVALDGAALPAFAAGAHVDVTPAGGLTRQYSLCNDPAETHRYQIAVLREADGRGGSRAMHDGIHAGDVLTIGAPRNQFALAPQAEASLLLAGGIGITPLLCMAQRLAAMGASFTLHYCTRSAERTAFREQLAQAPWSSSVHLHLDDGPPAQKLDLAALLRDPQPGTHLYACGPRGFMDAVLAAARAAGWPDDRVHVEFFGAAPVRQAGDGAFEVALASTGRVIPVAADQTVIAALAAAGVEVPTSCEQGVCGTCVTGVLAGTPDHRDLYFTPQEQAANDRFLPCCSRARTPRLVLDL